MTAHDPLMSRRLPHTASGIVWIAALLSWGCSTRAGDDAGAVAETPTVPVRVAVVAERLFHPSVVAPGQWRSTGEVVIAAPFAAYVETVRVEIGDRVSRGEVVATLVSRESRAAVVGAEQLRAAASDAAARTEAERALAEARAGLVRLPVTAPGAGVVIRRAVSTGSQVGEGTELFAVVPDGGMVFEAHVPAREAGEVAPGQRAWIAGEDGSTVAATVRRKLPLTAAGDQNALVWLAPDRAAPPAWLDRFASATVEIGAAHRSLAVPDAALVEDDLTGETRVARLIPSGRVVWVTVRLGYSEDGWHELLTPALAAGTRVVIEGQHGLPDSTRVTAAP